VPTPADIPRTSPQEFSLNAGPSPIEASADSTEACASARTREVFIGCHSKVWQGLAARLAADQFHNVAIGHRDLAAFAFAAQDRVWVLSYSRRVEDNAALIARLNEAGVAQIVYLSSSSVIVGQRTRCYEYPRVKQQAEQAVLALPHGKVLTVGLVYDQPDELPRGPNVATSLDELAGFIRSPNWPDAQGRAKHLLRTVSRPFSGVLERVAFQAYGALMSISGSFPCLLRPFDVLLRALGARWYGYVYLSNRLWISTIS
jgi:hypothetical protein